MSNTHELATILVIDDDLIQRKIIARLAGQADFQVVEAGSFDEAEVQLKNRKFDCITLDLSLGKESGALLLRTIADSGNRVPVIVISGAEPHVLKTTMEIAEMLQLKADLVEKPLKLPQLRELMQQSRQRSAILQEVRNSMRPFGADPGVSASH